MQITFISSILITVSHLVSVYGIGYLVIKTYSGSSCSNSLLFNEAGRLTDSCFSTDDGSYTILCVEGENYVQQNLFSSSNCSGTHTSSSYELGLCEQVNGVALYDKFMYTCSYEAEPWIGTGGILQK